MIDLGRIIQTAIKIRTKHMAEGYPMRINEGFKEAVMAHDLSAAFGKAGFYVFPEFPSGRGSIDAVFVRKDDLVVCEWKRLNRRSILKMYPQNKRMLEFDPAKEMRKYGFKDREWKVSRLWVCDSWLPTCVNWWVGKTSTMELVRPFGKDWLRGSHAFAELREGEGWDPYFWVWAYDKAADMSPKIVSQKQGQRARLVWDDGDATFVETRRKGKTKIGK